MLKSTVSYSDLSYIATKRIFFSSFSVLTLNYKPQNRQYKNTQIEKSLKTLINKGIEAKKGEKVDKTKCTITTI